MSLSSTSKLQSSVSALAPGATDKVISNKVETQLSLRRKCDLMLWGKIVDQRNALGIVRGQIDDILSQGKTHPVDAIDYFGDDPDAVHKWLEARIDLGVDLSATTGRKLVQHLVQNGKVIRESGQAFGGVATYKHLAEHCQFCLHGDNGSYSCEKCGRWFTFTPYEYQPFICVTYKPGTPESLKQIRLIEGWTGDLCMFFQSNMNIYMEYCHGGNAEKWFMVVDPRTNSPYDGNIRSRFNPTLCLTMNESDKNVYMVECNGRKSQQWVFQHGRIKNQYALDLCMDMHRGNRNLYMGACHTKWNQYFRWAVPHEV